jgi:hypothetical protein
MTRRHTQAKGRSPRLNGLLAGSLAFALCIPTCLAVWGMGIELAVAASSIVAVGVGLVFVI